MPEQEAKILPVMVKLFDAVFRLGYHKFKDAAKFALDKIRAVSNIESKSEVEAHTAQTWEGRAQPSPLDSSNQAPFAVSPQNAGEATTIPSGQSDFSVAAPAGDRNPAPSQGTKIEDSGAVLEGARKLYARAFAAKMAEGMDMDTAAVPLSKSWPEPDYQRLIDEGADPWAVSMARAMRDEIPTKPSSWKLKGWVQAVNQLRGFAAGALSGKFRRDDTRVAVQPTGGLPLPGHGRDACHPGGVRSLLSNRADQGGWRGQRGHVQPGQPVNPRVYGERMEWRCARQRHQPENASWGCSCALGRYVCRSSPACSGCGEEIRGGSQRFLWRNDGERADFHYARYTPWAG